MTKEQWYKRVLKSDITTIVVTGVVSVATYTLFGFEAATIATLICIAPAIDRILKRHYSGES